MPLPPEAAPLLALFAAEFTAPTAARFAAAPLTTGRRTVSGVLRTLRCLAPGHVTAYRRVLSRAEWSELALGCALARHVVAWLPACDPVRLAGDDTVDGHPSRTVYGKGRHRDSVRSSVRGSETRDAAKVSDCADQRSTATELEPGGEDRGV